MALRRPYIREATAYVPAPSAGWAPDVSPVLLPDNQAPILDNLIPFNGYVRLRGGFNAFADFTPQGTRLDTVGRLAVLFPATGSDKIGIIFGRAARTLSNYIDPWFAVRGKAGTSFTGSVAPGNTTLSYLQANGTLGTAVVAADVIPGPRWVNFGGQYYGISYDASTAPTTALTAASGGYTTRNTNLMTWALNSWGFSAAPPAATAWPTTAPRGAVDLKVHLSRLWLLGGVDVPNGGTLHSPTRLFYTNSGVGGTLGTVAADWKDTITGFTNQFEMDQDYSDPGVGLAVWRGQLIVFRDKSVWVVQGSTPTTFVSKRISQDVGCLDAKSIVETDNGVYFLSERGLMFTDGTVIRNVSGPVQHNLSLACKYIFKQSQYLGGYAECIPLSDGMIMVSLGSLVNVTVPDTAPIWSGVYNPTTGTWWRLTSTFFTGENLSSNEANLYPGHIFTPISPRNVALQIANKKLFLLDGLGHNMISGVFPQGDGVFDQDNTGAFVSFKSIPAKWRSRAVAGFSPGPPGQLLGVRQMRLDHIFPLDGNFSFDGITTGWHVALMNASNAVGLDGVGDTKIGSSPQVVELNQRPIPSIQRDYFWDFDMSDDAFFEVTLPTYTGSLGGGADQRQYEIYGAGFSFVPGPREPLP